MHFKTLLWHSLKICGWLCSATVVQSYSDYFHETWLNAWWKEDCNLNKSLSRGIFYQLYVLKCMYMWSNVGLKFQCILNLILIIFSNVYLYVLILMLEVWWDFCYSRIKQPILFIIRMLVLIIPLLQSYYSHQKDKLISLSGIPVV